MSQCPVGMNSCLYPVAALDLGFTITLATALPSKNKWVLCDRNISGTEEVGDETDTGIKKGLTTIPKSLPKSPSLLVLYLMSSTLTPRVCPHIRLR